MAFLGAGAEAHRLAFLIALFCPLLIAPPATFVFFRQTAELAAAHEALRKAHENLFAIHAELKSAHRSLEHRASHDGMTGLANREAFQARLDELKAAGEHGYLLMIDADRFKQINDEHGHDGGDRALLAIAEAISAAIRPGDFAARIGGEEFAVLLRQVGGEQAGQIAEGLRARVEAVRVATVEGTSLQVTVSIGCAAFTAQSRIKDDMRAADRMLYDAKRDGRNRVRITPGITRAA
ncbi:GGDEF domain-containing protein [Hoeflea olei]|nr:GGDEF domain-containing protein [Hoeflea olei]